MPHTQHRFYFWAMSISHTTLYVSVWIHWSCVCVCDKLRFRSFFFFFFLFSRVLEECGYCSLNSSRKCWLFNYEQCICALFMDLQIPLFSNFFIKNGSHGTIHTFKNYFTTVFSVFSFNKISSIQTDPKYYYREANKCTNALAKMGARSNQKLSLFNSAPINLSMLLFYDRHVDSI